MTRVEAWLVHVSTILVGGTGLVYAWMRYFLEPADPFSVVSHPLLPTVQHLHLWLAPLLVFAAGLIWRNHAWSHWKRGMPKRRRTGISLMLTLAPMTVSGYLIQTSVDETWRSIWVGLHLVTSGVWVLGYVVHQLSSRRRQKPQLLDGKGLD